MNGAGELTLADLMLQLGIRVGARDQPQQANNRFTIPEDPATRQLLLDAINGGRRELYSRLPDMRALQPTIEISLDPTGERADIIDADPSKYRLAHNIEGFAGGQFEWSALNDDGSSSGFGGIIRQCHQSDIQALHTSGTTSQLVSWPRAIALARTQASNPNEPGRRMVDYLWVYPKPDQPYAIRGQVRIGSGPLTELSDLEPLGQQHLESVLTFAERAFYIGRCPTEQWAILEQRATQAVAISKELDGVRGAQDLGRNIDPDAELDSRRYRPWRLSPATWAQVDQVSGQSVL